MNGQEAPPHRTVVGFAKPGMLFESPTLPLPPPKSAEDLQQILVAIAGAPSSERQTVVDFINGLGEKETVARLLHRELFDLPTHDASRTALLLSVIGQLGAPSSADELDKFLWLNDEQVLRPESHPLGDQRPGKETLGSEFGSSFLQARAAEMLVWVEADRAWERVRAILAGHPSAAVRVATIDALAYSAEDDPAALERLRKIVSDEDNWSIGMPRRSAETTEGFLDKLSAFQDRVEAPPIPRQIRAVD